MSKVFPVEIRNFSSIKELDLFLDSLISWYEAVLKEYNQNLGDLLRKPDGSQDEELLKKLSENMKQEQDTKKKGKKDKKSESPTSDWFSFKGLMFSANSKSMAEIFFEAVDVAKKNSERLKEVKSLIEELQKIGFASDLVYSIYFVNGVPQKIYIEKQSGADPKYKLEINLSTGDKVSVEAETPPKVEDTATTESNDAENEPATQA